MNPESLDQIIHLVESKMGLKPQSISFMIWQDNIQERMAACQLSDYEAYQMHLQSSPQEMQALIELMVNLETWFFRESKAFDYLAYLIKQKKIKVSHLKILSLACSTGEEPYSIVMTLFDIGLSENEFSVDAIDMSHHALNKAKVGIYRDNSFRSYNLNFQERYFDRTPAGYAIKDEVKKQVTFSEGNLLEKGSFVESHSYHVIFCRNLLIYLHHNAQMALFNCIKNLLAPEGILVVSSAETKIAGAAGFDPISFPGANAFKVKRG